MTAKRSWIVLTSVALAAAMAGAAAPDPEGDVAKLEWMAGDWGSDDGKVQMEEHWLAPKGGAMLGLHRDVSGGKMVEFEFLRMEKTPDGGVYFARPRGRPGARVRLALCAARRVRD